MGTNLVSSAIVQDVLRKNNYANWSVCVKNYLLGQDLWDIVEGPTEPKPEVRPGEKQKTEPEPEGNEAKFKTLRKKNAMALHAIQISCGPDILSQIREITSAKIAWEFLANMPEPQSEEVNSADEPVNTAGNPGMENDYVQYVALHKVVDSGDWDSVQKFLDLHPDAVSARISVTGKTALHAAAFDGHVKIVEKLVELMPEKDLELQDVEGYTPLAAVAVSGITQMAKCMVRKNKNLVGIETDEGVIPVVLAIGLGHKDITRYLYSVTPPELLTPIKGNNGATLLTHCIMAKLFDVALDLLQRCPHLAFALDRDGCSPVYILAGLASAFPSGSRHIFWQRWIYSGICVQPARASNDVRINIQRPHKAQSDRWNIIVQVRGQLHGLVSNLLKLLGIKKIYHQKLIHVQALELLHCICREIPALDNPQLVNGGLYVAIFQAVKNGIVEFIVEIIRANPDLMWITDMKSRDIFLCAIVYRQEKIFNLLYGFDTRKNSLTSRVDKFSNNMLHLAGRLAPSSRLDRISGAALQMQRELQWFKEVESVVQPKFKESPNLDGKTPRDLFTENHMNLKKEGEKYMKETATSCTVVAALIVTIMFAAAFTVPGGNNGDTGTPIFSGKTLFMVFIISDAISLFSSSTSVLMFLGILTSRYAEEDFLKSLPTKLIIGLSTLFFSIATMMIAFCAALVIMLRESKWVVIPIIFLASVPVTLFALLQFPLLVQIFTSTYGSGIFNRKMKRWY